MLVGLGVQFMSPAGPPGGGPLGLANGRAAAEAQAVAVFAAGCQATAAASPGLLAESIPVTLGVAGGASLALPEGAGCAASSAPGGRFIFAHAKNKPGMAHEILRVTSGSAIWFRVLSPGTATRISDGQQIPVPSSIPAGTVLSMVQVSN